MINLFCYGRNSYRYNRVKAFFLKAKEFEP